MVIPLAAFFSIPGLILGGVSFVAQGAIISWLVQPDLRLRTLGIETQNEQRAHMAKKLEEFRSHLEEFALKHRNDIRKDPQFRAQFHKMCAAVGVDPLASNKGVWAKLLGFGDFYYELGVQIAEATMAARSLNGGLMELGQLRAAVLKRRGRTADPVSDEDILRAIDSLKCLGGGWSIIDVGGRKVVRSVPAELSADTTAVLEEASATGFVAADALSARKGWTQMRSMAALDTLLRDGFAMVDDGAPDGVRLYWVMAVAPPALLGAGGAGGAEA